MLAIVGFVLLVAVLVVVAAVVLVFRFMDDVQHTERMANPPGAEPNVIRTMGDHWTKQQVTSRKISIESPSLLRKDSTDSDEANGYESFTGPYPDGCVDLYLMEADAEEPARESLKESVESWIADFDGSEDVMVRPAALPGIEASRHVFEARYAQDGYDLVHFVEIRPYGDRHLWVAVHAYQQTSIKARDDFVRIVNSLPTAID